MPSPPTTPTAAQAALDAAISRFEARNPRSAALHAQAVTSLPGGNTRTLLHTPPYPIFMKSGKGYQLTSEDGHTYTDLVGELTAGLFGHSHPVILSAIRDVLDNVGLNLGATTAQEHAHAAAVCARFGLGRVRFANSGTEANLFALAAARAFTGRRRVVVFAGGYHGGVLGFAGGRPAGSNVDAGDWVVARYNDVDSARRAIEDEPDVAAVLVEGMQGGAVAVPGRRDFLKAIEEAAKKAGVLFILDEVMTSRVAPGGLASLHGLQPDLTTFGKWLGGGLAFGAFGGRADVMAVFDPRAPGHVPHHGTFNNNTLAMHAGHAGLTRVYTPEVCAAFSAAGEALRERLSDAARGTRMCFTGVGTILGSHFLVEGVKEAEDVVVERETVEDATLKDLFWYEMLEEGFWGTRRGSVALVLGTPQEEMDRFVRCVEAFLQRHRELVKLG